MDKNEFDKRKSFKSNIGFYIALTICIATIAAAAWTTYGSVAEYNSQIQETTSLPSEDIKVNKDVSGQNYESSIAESSVKQQSSMVEVSETVSESESSISESTEPSLVIEESRDTSPRPPFENCTIIKKFSPKAPVKSVTTSDWRTHRGIDISAKSGEAVHAVRNGTVKSLYNDVMLGNVVCIEHIGGYTAYYCGLTDTPNVSEGDIVYAGDTIGYVGIVPLEMLDESHLHLEVQKNGEYIDPVKLFSK